MAATKAGVVRGKKKWFTVLAPEVFKSKELIDITAYEPNELKSRPVEINLMQITSMPKDQQRKLVLKVLDTRGEKVITEPWRYFLIDSFIQRSGRRYKEKFVSVVRVNSKDNRLVEVKWLGMGIKKLHHPVRAELLRKIEEQTKAIFSKYDFAELFVPAILDKITMDIKKETKTIYPLDKILVWKLSVA